MIPSNDLGRSKSLLWQHRPAFSVGFTPANATTSSAVTISLSNQGVEPVASQTTRGLSKSFNSVSQPAIDATLYPSNIVNSGNSKAAVLAVPAAAATHNFPFSVPHGSVNSNANTANRN